jgi:hypothetical protein
VKGWKFNGPLETDEMISGMSARKGVLNLDGIEGSGADWLERFKPCVTGVGMGEIKFRADSLSDYAFIFVCTSRRAQDYAK